MENEKKSNGTLVGIIIGIIIALIMGGCLFATGTIGFKTNTNTNTNNEQKNENTTTNDSNTIIEDNNTNTISTIKGVYSGTFNNNKIKYSTKLTLFSNNTFKMCERYECYDGEYSIDDNRITLVTKSTEVYPNIMTYKYTFSADKSELISNKKSEYCDLKKIISETSNNTTIQAKLIDNLNCNNSETKFNGITVKIEQKRNNDVCSLSSITINGKDIKNDISMWINSYEIYDNNVIILSGDTSGTLFTIYNSSNNQIIEKINPNNLEGYWVTSYKTNNNKIIINGKECGEQCGNKSTGYTKAIFELEYYNGSFSPPKLIEKSVY